MLNTLKNTLSSALSGCTHKPTKTNLSEIDFSLSCGTNTVTIRGSHKFKVFVDEESTRGGWRSQTLTALIYDADCQEMALPQLKITQDGRLTKIWLCVSERQNSFSDYKKETKQIHSQEEISHAVEVFDRAYEKVRSYIENPRIEALRANLDGLGALSRVIAKLNKMRIFKYKDLDLNAIQEKCYDDADKPKAIELLALHEEIILSKKRPLADFGYIKKKAFPEAELTQFGTFGSSSRRVNGRLENQLALPLYGGLDGHLIGYQTISSDGGKYYHLLKGTKSCGIFATVQPLEELQAGELTLCEGFATGLSLKLINPESKILITLDANGLKSCTRKFQSRELVHALDNDTRLFSEKHKKNSGIEFSIQIESELNQKNPENKLQIKRIAPAAPAGFNGFKIDFDDLRIHFKNDFNTIQKHLSESKFIFNQITDLNDKSNYFVHSRYLSAHFLPDFSTEEELTLSINAATGGGKTTLLKEITSQVNSAIYVCPRISLTTRAAGDLGLYVYRDLIDLEEKYLPDFSRGLKAATTVHSFWRVVEKFNCAGKIECLVLDEADQIFSELKDFSAKNNDKRLSAIYRAIQSAKKVILLSATLSHGLLAEIRKIRHNAENIHIYNTCAPNRGKCTLFSEEKAGAIYEKIMRESLQENKKIALSCDCANSLTQIFDDLKKNFPNRRALLCTGEKFDLSFKNTLSEKEIKHLFFANPDDFLQQYHVDTLIYSPILQTGFSIDTEFDIQYFDYSLFAINPKSQLQQTMRLRNVKKRIGRVLDLKKQIPELSILKKDFIEARNSIFTTCADRISQIQWDSLDSHLAAPAIEALRLFVEKGELTPQENLVFCQIYDDEIQYKDYRESFVNLLKMNGLETAEEGICDSDSEFKLSTKNIKFAERAQKFFDENQSDILKETLEKTLVTNVGLRVEHTKKQLGEVENLNATPTAIDIARLTIYKNPKKYLNEAKNFLLLNDLDFEKEFIRTEVFGKESLNAIDSRLAKINIVRTFLPNLESDEKLIKCIQSLRRKSKKVNRNVKKEDLLKLIFNIPSLKCGEKLTPQIARATADKVLSICGLSVDLMRGKNIQFMEFWENFTNELKTVFVNELKQKTDLKEDLYCSSEQELEAYKTTILFNNKSTFVNAKHATTVGASSFEHDYQKVDILPRYKLEALDGVC